MSHTIIGNKKGKIIFEHRGPELLKVHIINMNKHYHFFNIVSLKASGTIQKCLVSAQVVWWNFPSTVGDGLWAHKCNAVSSVTKNLFKTFPFFSLFHKVVALLDH